jgi:3',5'-cyclic AMP phosphodiesterase CpdA
MTKLVALADLHLSPVHGFFWDNWCIAREFVNALDAGAVVINGDLCINGPDSDLEVEFAAQALQQITSPVLALPGNHDVGDEPPGQDFKQLITADRLARWRRFAGPDHWAFDAGNWRLIGVNAQLFGSALAAETDQALWLDHQLAIAGRQPCALFLHKPLFLESPEDREETSANMSPAARSKLLPKLHAANVRLVVSGHLHQSRDRTIDGIRYIWLPAVAFAAPRPLGGLRRCGVTSFEFSDGGVDVKVEYPEGLISHDLSAIKQNGRYAFLRDMPPCPPSLCNAQ